MKYKVGDKVRVREWDDMEKEFGLDSDGYIRCKSYFTSAMKKFCGKIFTVGKVSETYYNLKGGESFCFSDDMLEPVCDKKIVITTDGKTTLARLYDGKNVIKTAKAKCSPDDEFDFITGAELAFDRLNSEDKPKFKVGDKIIGNEKANVYSITRRGWIGTVENVYDNGRIEANGFDLDPDCFDLYVEPYYNGKAVCVEAKKYAAYTVGKIYKFIDGKVRLDNGNLHPVHTRIKNLDEWNDNSVNLAKFIELKE